MIEFNDSKCNICGFDQIKFTGRSLRENSRCERCYSQLRVRFLKYILDEKFNGWEEANIHEVSPSPNSFVKKLCKNYSSSYYNDNEQVGKSINGLNLNSEDLFMFGNEFFDLIIHQDVLEHIIRPDKAMLEFLRVIKKGGSIIFTVPRYSYTIPTRPRISIDENANIQLLLNREYHGGPYGKKSLVTYDYGSDFIKLLKSWTNKDVQVYNLSKTNIVEVFIITK